MPIALAAIVSCTSALHGQTRCLSMDCLPDAPQPASQAQTAPPQTPPPQTIPAQPPAQTGQNGAPTQQPNSACSSAPLTKEQQQQKADEELKQEEKQRIMGVVPNFNTTNDQNAPPLTPKQKFHLFFRSSIDPFEFVAAGLDAGVEQADNSFPEYGQGMEGYGKRIGASYADTFDGNLWGNAILPSLLHEDPRYFRMGTGTFWHRAVYSAKTNVWSKRDNGTWGPNYANVGGNFIGGALSNLYYPASDRGFSLTVERAVTVTAEGAIGSALVEFWPDISQHVFHHKARVLVAQPPSTGGGQPAKPPCANGNASSPNPQ